MKRLTRALTPGLGRVLAPGLAEALAARAVFLVGRAALTEAEVCEALLGPLQVGRVLDADLISERANNLATAAHLHLTYGREVVA